MQEEKLTQELMNIKIDDILNEATSGKPVTEWVICEYTTSRTLRVNVALKEYPELLSILAKGLDRYYPYLFIKTKPYDEVSIVNAIRKRGADTIRRIEFGIVFSFTKENERLYELRKYELMVEERFKTLKENLTNENLTNLRPKTKI